MNLKGRYKWIVFLPSKTHPGVPVLNRYYGVFDDGRVKVRGIEARRRDTPRFIRDAQLDMVNVLAEASNGEQFKEKIPDSLEVLRGYAEKLVDHNVPNHQLFIAKQLSKYPHRYIHHVHQAIAAQQLTAEGVNVSPGQTVKYLITDADHRKANRRVKAAELVTEATRYDVKKYVDLLLSAGANILRPFGYTKRKLRDAVLYQEHQSLLPQS